MKNKTWFKVQASASEGNDAAEIFIFDEIGGWGIGANEFRHALNEVRDAKSITLKVNSPGGDVMTAYAIHNMIRETKVPVTARVVGIAASAASYIALAADKIESFDNALFHIHEAWGVAVGTADEMRQTADFLEQNSDMMLGKYAARSGMTLDELKGKLKAEGGDWWMNGNAAHDAGFVDEVLDQQVALSALTGFDTRRFAIMPKELSALTEEAPTSEPETVVIETPAAEPTTEPEEAPHEVAVTTEELKPEAFVEQAAASLKKARATRAQVESLEAQITSLSAKVSELEAAVIERDALKASIAKLSAEIAESQKEEKTLAAKAAEIAASHGLKPDACADLPAPLNEAHSDIAAQFAAIKDPAERTAFYKANKDKLTSRHLHS